MKKNTCKQSYITRPLGKMESTQYLLSEHAGIARNVVVSLELDNNFSNQQVINCLQFCHQKFIALRLRIIEKEENAYLEEMVELSSIKICEIETKKVSSQNHTFYCEKEMNLSINCKESMWRATLLKTEEKRFLLLTFHHAIFDGGSIKKIIYNLENTTHKEKCTENHELYPAIESLATKNKILFNNKKSDGNDVTLRSWQNVGRSNILKHRSKWIDIPCNDIEIIALKRFSKQHKITINHLLNAITIKAISTINHRLQQICLHTPVDLSKHYPDHSLNKEIGCFTGILHIKMQSFINMSIVEIAANYAKKFNADLKDIFTTTDFNYNELKKHIVDTYSEYNGNFHGGLAISNLGSIELKSSSLKPRIREVKFSTSLTGGIGFMLMSILTFNNKLNITLTYTDPLLKKSLVQQFINNFKSITTDITKQIPLGT